MNGIEKITAAILSEAEKEANELLESAKARAAEIAKENEEKAAAVTRLAGERAEREKKVILDRAVSSSSLIRRNALLDAKSVIINTAYMRALEKLLSQPDDEYLVMLKSIFKETVKSQIESERLASEHDTYGEFKAVGCYTLMLDDKTDSRIGERFLKEASDILASYGKKLVKSEKHADINGGFVLVCGDVELSCALPVIMKQLREETEGEVYRMLFAE